MSKQGNIIQASKRKENFMGNDIKKCPGYIFNWMKLVTKYCVYIYIYILLFFFLQKMGCVCTHSNTHMYMHYIFFEKRMK